MVSEGDGPSLTKLDGKKYDSLTKFNPDQDGETNVAIVDILVPQMGEGLTEVRILEFHKKPGDRVKRDEILYSMETDKATMEVESAQEGVLIEWLAQADEVLPIGTPI